MKKKKRRKRIRIAPIIILVLMSFIIIACVICFGKLFINHDTKEKKEAESIEQSEEKETEKVTQDFSEDTYLTGESPFMIKVNRAANCTTIYTKDDTGNYSVPVKAMLCSTGKNIDDTPLGTFHTSEKYKWRMMVDGSYAQYAYRIFDEIMLHSVPYFDDDYDELETDEFNKLGSPASLGCVRFAIRDIKWIYDNCPVGTTVIIYDDADNPGPLGKPEAIKIPEDSENAGWDPTDINKDNPWHTASPIIINAVDLIVKTGSTIDFTKHVTAYDTCGNDISDKIAVTGDYDFNTPGIYEITYTITDLLNRTVATTVWLTVTDLDVETQPLKKVTIEHETTAKYNYDDYEYTTYYEEPSTEETFTEAPTETYTETYTEAYTEASTEAYTEASTEASTEAYTEAYTEASTEEYSDTDNIKTDDNNNNSSNDKKKNKKNKSE